MKNLTVELLSVASNADDLWQELHKEYNTSQLMVYMLPNYAHHIRLLGPFMSAQRIYIPKGVKYEYMQRGKLEGLLQQDYNLIKELKDEVQVEAHPQQNTQQNTQRNTQRSRTRRQSNYNISNSLQRALLNIHADVKMNTSSIPHNEHINFLNKVESSSWQNCAISNCLIENEIKLITLHRPMTTTLFDKVHQVATILGKEASDIKISGLHAHNIAIQKEGRGLNVRYNVLLSDKPSHLFDDEVAKIFKVGLLDIFPTLNKLTFSSSHPFIYRVEDSYRMAKNLYSDLHEESLNKNDDKQLNEVEKHINNLPIDAFENAVSSDNPIGSLEL